MKHHRNSLCAVVVILVAGCGMPRISASAQQISPDAVIREDLQTLAKFSPDPCGPPYGFDQDSTHLESKIIQAAAEEVTRALNSLPTSANTPKERATESLEAIRKMSAEVDGAWPEENRFQFEVLDLSPALVLKIAIRSHAHYYVFGIPDDTSSGKPNHEWQQVGSDDADEQVPWLSLELYPLHRGPSGNPRFLAKFVPSGCAGSIGVAYDAREWSPTEFGSFDQIVKLTGAFGLDDKVAGFPQIGKLKTEGVFITLPYCWFSPIDTWDNPSMCAVDEYDLSGDTVKCQARTYNRPDLFPIAKALEYAEQRDYPAVRAYCGSPAIARALVRTVPPFVFADDLKTRRIRRNVESVTFDSGFRFVVAKTNGRWMVTKFSAN